MPYLSTKKGTNMQTIENLRFEKTPYGWICTDDDGVSGQGKTKEMAKANYDLQQITKPVIDISNYNPFA